MDKPRDPSLNDQDLADFLARECGVKLERITVSNARGSKLVACSTTSSASPEKAKLAILSRLKPAPESVLLDALQSLREATGAKKTESDDGADMQADRYVSKLREYPADIVLFTLATWDDQPPPAGLFFPKWAELKPMLDGRFAWRRQVLPAVQACVPFDRLHEAEPPPSEEDIADVRAMRDKTVAMLSQTTRSLSQTYAAPHASKPRSEKMRMRFET